ncbi:hypothetical protein EDD17DRAFT_1474132, partial [Pisolithus thermaeus]
VTCVQVWYYYVSYPTDPWHIKTLVLRVFASDTVHQALVTHSAYIYLVSDIVNPAGLADLVCFSVSIDAYSSSRRSLLVGASIVSSWLQLNDRHAELLHLQMSSVIAEFGEAITRQFPFSRITHHTLTVLSVSKYKSQFFNATTAVSDVLIAGCLCFLLQKSRTGFRRSDTMINKLMLFSLNTGLLTGIFAVASLISISLWPNAFIYIAFYFCVGRLYCNSLLATLNARRIIRAASTDDDMSLSLQGARKTNLATSQRVRPVPNNISIKIDTTHELVRDDARDEVRKSHGVTLTKILTLTKAVLRERRHENDERRLKCDTLPGGKREDAYRIYQFSIWGELVATFIS